MKSKYFKLRVPLTLAAAAIFLFQYISYAAPAPENLKAFNALSAAAGAQADSVRISSLDPAVLISTPFVRADDRHVLPINGSTPGNLCSPDDPNFKEYRYQEHVAYCNRYVTRTMKVRIAARYNVPESEWPDYEFDHLIPLGIGGNSSDDNIWPQPRSLGESADKDKLENLLYRQMAAGTITQADAVKRMYAWFYSKDVNVSSGTLSHKVEPGKNLFPEFSDPCRVTAILGLVSKIYYGEPFDYPQDGTEYLNAEKVLPAEPSGYYRQYTVRPGPDAEKEFTLGEETITVSPPQGDGGAERIITGTCGEIYYSPDYGGTFTRIYVVK
ncbi:MAG: ribonuclease domain-containing protein [Elusimicrobiaceae bacterium]|jgi:hypothetical protein